MSVPEQDPRLSRALAAVLLMGALSCRLDRAGLDERGAAGAYASDARGDAAIAGDGSAGVGGAAGASLGADGGATGDGGAAGDGGAGAGEGDGGRGAGGAGASDAAGDRGDVADTAGDRTADRALDSDGTGIDAPADLPLCAVSPLCAAATTVTPPGGRFTGRTAGTSLDRGSCGGGQAPEAVFNLVLTERSDLFVTTHGTAFDTVIYLRNDCCGAELGCNDDADGRHTSVLAEHGLAPGSYSIFIDGAHPGDAGSFTVDIYATPTSTKAADDCGNPARISTTALTSTTCGLEDDFSPLSGCLVPPATTSADAVYYFVLDAPSTTVTFNTCTRTCINTVLFVRDICTAQTSQRACNDDFCSPATAIPPAATCPAAALPTQSRTTATLGPGVHYLVVDSHVAATAPACGAFTITPAGVPQ